ncbi:MAG: hypothetical protein M3Q50_08240, partial [Chloroflexota bacterium]|nr:hypothetical protein [Chloroflexota bacterium]
ATTVGTRQTIARPRVLRSSVLEIGDELLAGGQQLVLVDDVVPIKDTPGSMTGQEHGDPLGHSPAY